MCDDEEYDGDAHAYNYDEDYSQGFDSRQLSGMMEARSGDLEAHRAPLCQSFGETFTPAAALARMQRDAAELAATAFVSTSAALIILKHFKWSLVRAKESYFDRMESLQKSLKIDGDDSCGGSEPQWCRNVDSAVTCGVCWEDCEPCTALTPAPCTASHWFCESCWRGNLHFELVRGGGTVVGKRCMSKGCSSLVSIAMFEALLSPATSSSTSQVDSTQLQKAILREYVELNATMKWCANPKGQCDRLIAVTSNRDGYQEVRCDHCSYRFCFNCGCEAHGPATCKMLLEWQKKEVDDSETANWMTANTKSCPRCNKAVEKNGGCNHMTCSCKHEWCWVCEGEWAKHGSSYYNCNYFDPKQATIGDKNRNAARESLQRYMFYYSRYKNHARSQSLDTRVMQQVQRRIMEELTKQTSTVTSGRYLEETAEVLFDCRHTLRYTYVFAFYLPDDHQKKLFEYQQAQLECATEELSRVIEGQQGMEPQSVIDKTAIAKKYHTELSKGLWSQEEH